MKFCLGNSYVLYAEFFKRKGDRLKAQENLGKAIEILRECGADGWVSKYEREMASLRHNPFVPSGICGEELEIKEMLYSS